MTTITLKNYKLVSKILDSLENLFWRDELDIDTETSTVFLFKAYPSGLKGVNLDNWIALQKRHLNPFLQGYTYSFNGSSGLSLWFSKSPLNGMPETALQPPLEDGVHYVKGELVSYKQRWSKGEMLQCETLIDKLPANIRHIELKNVYNANKAWAYQRQIDKLVVQPWFWLAAISVVFFVWLSHVGGGKMANVISQSSLEKEEERIQEELGDKLALQDRLQRATAINTGLSNWSQMNGNLPSTLSIVIDKVLAQSTWSADAIDWQANKLTIVLRTNELDIALLVSSIEGTGKFENVSIRPNNRANVWNLEVSLKDA